jgi:hypothetical protein
MTKSLQQQGETLGFKMLFLLLCYVLNHYENMAILTDGDAKETPAKAVPSSLQH